jgi:1-deoxy-D-xylulose-5-phosphate reductoisomerase
MVSFRDGSVMAQLGIPDMTGAIAYAMSFPERLDIKQPVPDFTALGALTFLAPDLDRFPCLRLAVEACRAGETLPAVLNAANEVAVSAFLQKKLPFVDIPGIIETTLNDHRPGDAMVLADIMAADTWARDHAADLIENR